MSEKYGVISKTSEVISDLIRGKIHDRNTIANRLGIAVAAADRYIRHLQGVPGVVPDRQGRRLAIRFDFGEAVPRPSYPAAVAACWAAGLAEVFSGSDYERGVREALAYVTGRARRSGEFKHVDRKFLFLARGGESSLPDSSGFLDDLIDAVLRCRYVDLEYFHFDGRQATVRLQPLSMAIYDHQIYMIGGAPDGARYPYRLSRIKSVEVANESFEYPERAVYDPKQLFHDSFGIFISDPPAPTRVRLLLNSKWKIHCRTHKWHISQRIEEAPEGVIVTLTVRVCWELTAWILGFGADAVVLEPQALVDEVRDVTKKMAASYVVADAASPKRAGPRRASPEATSGSARKIGK
jgi:predicted DNA-binding transcriptional regulator YafY